MIKLVRINCWLNEVQFHSLSERVDANGCVNELCSVVEQTSQSPYATSKEKKKGGLRDKTKNRNGLQLMNFGKGCI